MSNEEYKNDIEKEIENKESEVSPKNQQKGPASNAPNTGCHLEGCPYQPRAIRSSIISDKWYQKVWRPMLSIVFAGIVIVDLAIMPVVVEYKNPDQNSINIELLKSIDSLNSENLKLALVNNSSLTNRSWEPVTTSAGGLFYVAFGAILGGSAWTRGQEKIQRIKSHYG